MGGGSKGRSVNPLDRLRLEKAAADCGFEMTPLERGDGLELRSARFPETVVVRPVGLSAFEVVPSNPLMLDIEEGSLGATLEGYEALYAALRTAAARARTLPNRVADAFRRETAGMPRSTESERTVVQRVGQNLFRAALLDYWQGRCCVTGLDVPDLLRASHIKPWAACDSDDERLDVFNGLLLAPHLDALFDGGWMTFDDHGAVVISPLLPAQAWGLLAIRPEWCIPRLTSRHRYYLAFHRQRQYRNR